MLRNERDELEKIAENLAMNKLSQMDDRSIEELKDE